MSKGDEVIITATQKELLAQAIPPLSVNAILEDRHGYIYSAGRRESEVRTALGIWVLPNDKLEVLK